MGIQLCEFSKALFRAEVKTARSLARLQFEAGGKPRGHGARILRVVVVNGREWQLHATKGWRSRRA